MTPMTVPDIQSKQFHVRFRGFDAEEVDAFLEKAAAALQAALDENQKLTERLKEMEKELAGYQRQQQSFQNAIMAAQNIADQMKEKSSREAEELLASARAEARRLQDQASNEVTALERELDRLQALKSEAREELRQQITSYLRMLEPQTASWAKPGEDLTLTGSTAAATLEISSPPVATTREPAQDLEHKEGPDTLASGEEDDLSDLYTRIDLSEEALLDSDHGEEDLFAPTTLEYLPPDAAEKEEPVPDLDGDMVFTLEDPLDEQEPAISFLDEEMEEEERPGKKKDLFSPDDSPL